MPDTIAAGYRRRRLSRAECLAAADGAHDFARAGTRLALGAAFSFPGSIAFEAQVFAGARRAGCRFIARIKLFCLFAA